jgi:23S rRNA A1618 N6-methylase RlmF
MRLDLNPVTDEIQVPNRLNYLLWIQSLLDTTSDAYTDTYDPQRQVLGLDIGTGASCIYPLLGCAQRPKWRFAGTGISNLIILPTATNLTRRHRRQESTICEAKCGCKCISESGQASQNPA